MQQSNALREKAVSVPSPIARRNIVIATIGVISVELTVPVKIAKMEHQNAHEYSTSVIFMPAFKTITSEGKIPFLEGMGVFL